MRKFVLPFLATIAVASPAFANEARVEVRGGVLFSSGVNEDVYGVAAGYDVDMGKQGFVGLEVSADKVAASGTDVAFGVSGRAGYKADTGTRLFVSGGYTSKICSSFVDTIHAGAGFEQNIGSNAYGKLEYRHYFAGSSVPDFNAVVLGVGYRF